MASGARREPRGRQLQVLRGEVDADRAAPELARDHQRRAGAAERVEHDPAGRTGGEDGAAAQVGRDRREVPGGVCSFILLIILIILLLFYWSVHACPTLRAPDPDTRNQTRV